MPDVRGQFDGAVGPDVVLADDRRVVHPLRANQRETFVLVGVHHPHGTYSSCYR